MFFFNQTKRLWLEFFKFKRLKSLPLWLSIILGILLSPFILVFIILIGVLFLCAIIYSLLSAPIEYLHGILKEEIKEKHPAVQVVLYFISWSILFPLYVTFAFFSFYIYFFYFLVSLVGWLVSLAGFKFHLSPNEENIENDIPVRVKKEKAPKAPKQKKEKGAKAPKEGQETPKEAAPKEEEPKEE